MPGVYYIGVKAEDQQAAEYALLAVFSLFPFSEEDALGNQTLYGFPVPAPIPDATRDSAQRIQPGVARIFAFAPGPDLMRRVIVTNWLAHGMVGDLLGQLSHGGWTAILNDHTTNGPSYDYALFDQFIYDDSGEANVPRALGSDGPGTLADFGGREGTGQWLFTQADDGPAQIGTNGPLIIFLERQQDLEEGVEYTLEFGTCRRDFVRVPVEATNPSDQTIFIEAAIGFVILFIGYLQQRRTGLDTGTLRDRWRK